MTTEPTTLSDTLDMIRRELVEVENLLEIAIDQAAAEGPPRP